MATGFIVPMTGTTDFNLNGKAIAKEGDSVEVVLPSGEVLNGMITAGSAPFQHNGVNVAKIGDTVQVSGIVNGNYVTVGGTITTGESAMGDVARRGDEVTVSI